MCDYCEYMWCDNKHLLSKPKDIDLGSLGKIGITSAIGGKLITDNDGKGELHIDVSFVENHENPYGYSLGEYCIPIKYCPMCGRELRENGKA